MQNEKSVMHNENFAMHNISVLHNETTPKTAEVSHMIIRFKMRRADQIGDMSFFSTWMRYPYCKVMLTGPVWDEKGIILYVSQ